MLLDEYQKLALKTAIYPREGVTKIMYPTLGLASEAGEVAGKIKKVVRDLGGIVSPDMRESIILELGDTLWYIAALSNELNIPLSEIAEKNISKLSSRAEKNKIQGSGDSR